MKRASKTSRGWTVTQTALLSGVCLAVGIGGGWGIHAAQRPAVAETKPIASGAAGGTGQAAAPTDIKQVADAEAAPQLAKLKTDPNNPALLTAVGNIYYDAHVYPLAVEYYGEVLKARPSDVSVRTDMGTAYWFMGDADRAIAEFKQALGDAPTSANTLFNLGLVELQGKKDPQSAIANWEKLLAANPGYEQRATVEQMLAQAKQQAAGGAAK